MRRLLRFGLNSGLQCLATIWFPHAFADACPQFFDRERREARVHEVVMSKYSITCAGMNERDAALIKSLVGIVGKGQGAEWVYSDEPDADVVIIDTDTHKPGALKTKPRAIVAYASPDKTLIPNTFALSKPARARDLMEVLASIHGSLAG